MAHPMADILDGLIREQIASTERLLEIAVAQRELLSDLVESLGLDDTPGPEV